MASGRSRAPRRLVTAAAAGLVLWLGGCSAEPVTAAAADNRPAEAAESRSQPAPPRSGVYADDAAAFALGNVLFILYHEIGHALISQYQLPVLGREEDAVDQFAALLLVPQEGEPDQDASILTDAIAGWFLSSARTSLAEIAWWGEHGPDQQRAYQIACLLYGSSPGAYDALADEIALPPERRERCPQDFQSVEQSWGVLLADHVLAEGDTPPHRVSVSYAPAGAYQAEHDLLRESELLETVANDLSTAFRLPGPIAMVARACGEPNAFWDPQASQIIVCYELIRDYRELHASAG
jgi:hypothetical protein